MNGKDRTKLAIERKPPYDRLPVSYEAAPEVTKTLIQHFGIDKLGLPIEQVNTMNSFVGPREGFSIAQEIELLKMLHVDVARAVCPVNPYKCIGHWWGLPVTNWNEDGKMTAAWGLELIRCEYETGAYIELSRSPLEGDRELAELEKHPMPDIDLYDYARLRDILPRYEGMYTLMQLNGPFDFAKFIRGTEDFLMDLIAEPEKAQALMEKVCQYALDYLDKCAENAKDLINGIYCGDDFGTQQGMLFSPETFRRMVKPLYKKIVDKVHGHGWKYIHHSCGGIYDIIPDLIDLGVDVLNPIQPRAKGMDPATLAKEFGRDITFYGAIDQQGTLPNGTPEDVRNEVRERCATLGRYGGYIISSSHRLQPDTPVENILAMYSEGTKSEFN